MKKTLLVFAILVFSINSYATHQRVLELIYDHVPGTNKYIFTLIEQVALQTTLLSADVASNSPSGTITLPRVQSIPLSGNCTSKPWVNIYRSDTIDLGPIPAAGYTFGHNTCCRTPAIDNIPNSAGKGFYIEAQMFPEPGQSYASSSPRFVNIAHTSWLQASPFILTEPAMDPDGDSIFYTLTDVRQGTLANNAAISYYNGFSGSTPLGSANPITINQARGVFTCPNTIPLGIYQFNVQITSLKNNIVTSVIHRDLIGAVSATPPALPSISLNNYSGTGPLNLNSNGVFQITVKTEDSVSFDINGSVLLDSIFLAGTSRLFDLTTNTAGNCLGNCADFMPNPNLQGLATATGKFSFSADSTHPLGRVTAKYQVAFLAASQSNCMPLMFANLFVDVTVIKKSNIGIAENEGVKFKVYPNPTTGILQIESDFSKPKEVRILNALGQEVSRFLLQEGEKQINLSGFAKGLYFLVDEDGGSQRVVLQ